MTDVILQPLRIIRKMFIVLPVEKCVPHSAGTAEPLRPCHVPTGTYVASFAVTKTEAEAVTVHDILRVTAEPIPGIRIAICKDWGMEIHFSILARRITWTEEPDELQSTGVAKNQT